MSAWGKFIYDELTKAFGSVATDYVQADTTGPPTTTSAGVDVEESGKVIVDVGARDEVDAHRSRVQVETVDDSATYTVTIDGNSVSYTAQSGDGVVEILEGLASAINDDATVSGIVTASTQDTDGDDAVDELVCENDAGDGETHTTSVSADGSGALTFDEDATSGNIRVYVRPDTDENPGLSLGWRLARDAQWPFNHEGLTERINVLSYTRAYVRIYNLSGPSGSGDAVVTVHVGRAITDRD